MLLDMLGILIGFVAIILLLSILVTASIQTVSSFARLRHRALVHGIDEAQLESLGKYVEQRLAAQLRAQGGERRLLDPKGRVGPGAEAAAAKREARRKAAVAGEAGTGAVAEGVAAIAVTDAAAVVAVPTGRERSGASVLSDEVIAEIGESISREIQEARNDKRVTWLNARAMLKPVRAAGAHAFILSRAEQQLAHALRVMEDKYLQWTRVITFAAAFIIAGLFQVSTPELLERLQNDDEFRLRAEAAGEQLVREMPNEFETILIGPSMRARKEFLQRHPQYTAQLGEMVFEPRSVNDLVADFETALDAEENRDALAAEYRELVEKELASPESLREAARKSVSGLAGLGIEPVVDGTFFTRFGNPDYFIGVLVSAVLLSFGAPFWYRILKELVGLKDALRKKQSQTTVATQVKVERTARS